MAGATKRIISLILALTLVSGCVFAFSSCLYTYDILTGQDEGNGEGDSSGSGNQNTSQNNTGGGGSDQNGDEPVEYYPVDNTEELKELDGAAKTLLSTVIIDARFDIYNSYPYGTTETTEHSSYGSGVIYKLDKEKGDAYIITNYHVVFNSSSATSNGISDKINLYLYGQHLNSYAIEASYVGGSMNYDLAVLKVEGSEVIKNSAALAASIGDSEKVNVFDKVYAVGNPEGFGMSATDGMISVESETLKMTGADGRTMLSLRVMRISAAINDGNSGGGLYDTEGKLIVIVNAKRTGSDVDNIAYAIPINLAKNIAENIISNCDGKTKTSLYRCMLGVTLTAKVAGVVVDGETDRVTKVEIVEVESLTDDSIMKGKLSVGDIITSITLDGVTVKVTRIHHVIDLMMLAKVGSTVTINATRGGVAFETRITVPESAITEFK